MFSGDFDKDEDIAWDEDQPMDDPQIFDNGPRRKNRGGRNFGRGRGFGGPPPLFGPPVSMRPPRPFGPRGPPGMRGPPIPPCPPFMWGRGFGPGGPPIQKPHDNRALRYLMRCGVAKENLKNLPRGLLQLIEPEYCGLCAQSFESFNISRLHYISKNHLKSQKKWLAQQSEVGFLRPKEIPLKSRDLYCELCDVHITSKSHAESHYAGKSHRAIVEGRKQAKNPTLLQRGMHDRLEQLIRREKKHLKPVAEESEAVEETAKEQKPIQPELYCDICKTSVTCTEQMTMHLNGKKHLTKEKQHILKMMKGDSNEHKETTATETTETEAVATEAAATEAAATEAAASEATIATDFEEKDDNTVEAAGDGDVAEAVEPEPEPQDDWTNGSGNWDDQ